MILISINFHFLWISEYESMLVQAGSFWIPFSLLETVVCNYNDTTFYCNLYTNSLKYVRCTVFFLQIKVNLVLILQNIFFAGKGITIDHCAKFGSSHDVLLLMSELYQVHYLLDFKASFSSRSTTSSHWAHSKWISISFLEIIKYSAYIFIYISLTRIHKYLVK